MGQRMSSNQLSLQYDDSEVQAKLSALLQVSGGDEKAMGRIETALFALLEKTFRTEIDPYGVPWASWKHPEQMEKARTKIGKEGETQILVFTSALYDSKQGSHDATTATLTIGEGLPDAYAIWQQFGVPENNLPSRKMFPLKSIDEADFPQDWVDQILTPLTYMLNTVLQ